jgi:hypothetical protein
MRFITIFLVLGILLSSCKNDPLKVDVSKIKVSLQIHRLDQTIAKLKTDSIETRLPEIIKEYGTFAELYSNQIIKVGSMYNADYVKNLKVFLNYEVFDDINELIIKEFGSTKLSFEPKLTEAFKHYKYFFPKNKIPNLYTFNGGFNQSIVIDSSVIGIGLDKYLGTNCSLYKHLELEQYKKDVMYPDKITSDVMFALAESEFPFNFSNENLLSTMINEGRKIYFTKAMIPNQNDTVIWGFSSKQIKFCNESEKYMWDYLVDNKLLFNSDYMNIKRFTGEGPFTSAFSKESPARAASWIGYQIVLSYMNHNSISLSQLMKEDDFQRIMNKSKYNP